MEQSKLETPKSPETMHMQIRSMCGDHPFTKTELNVKDSNEEEKEKERSNSSYPHLTPTSSRTERGAGLRARTCSEDAVRALEVRRRAVDVQQRAEHDPLSNNRALLQAGERDSTTTANFSPAYVTPVKIGMFVGYVFT
ncbi:unnamed protein product [Leptidea sinapis]|uniref:Uncharacterized protein n=1 Tax=Leptidea sinapis TaxID=189913 RepID=A0A5E4PX58_9NEOP|nr:unnamed protein product [Leptidea sinapis]